MAAAELDWLRYNLSFTYISYVLWINSYRIHTTFVIKYHLSHSRTKSNLCNLLFNFTACKWYFSPSISLGFSPSYSLRTVTAHTQPFLSISAQSDLIFSAPLQRMWFSVDTAGMHYQWLDKLTIICDDLLTSSGRTEDRVTAVSGVSVQRYSILSFIQYCDCLYFRWLLDWKIPAPSDDVMKEQTAAALFCTEFDWISLHQISAISLHQHMDIFTRSKHTHKTTYHWNSNVQNSLKSQISLKKERERMNTNTGMFALKSVHVQTSSYSAGQNHQNTSVISRYKLVFLSFAPVCQKEISVHVSKHSFRH